MRFLLSIMVTGSLFISGCGNKNPGGYTTAATGDSSGANPILQAADASWESRVDEAQLKAALDKYKEAHEADPSNRHALVQLTRGWYFWGDAFTDDKDVKIERWGTAIEYGKKCISLNAEVAGQINAGEKEGDAAAAHATLNDVPCLYWTSSALGKWGKAQGIAKTLRYLPTVKAYMSTAERLDPTYYHYGPARYWGAYYSALPSFAGRDLEKSGEYFAASIEGAPDYFGTRVLRAEYLHVLTDDVKGFDADLAFVLDGDPEKLGAVSAENKKEQEKARKLIEKRNEFFSKKALEEAGQ